MFFKDRSLITLGLSAFLIFLISSNRNDTRYAKAPEWYWQMKLEWNNEADVILAGNSRVYRGLVPDEFKKINSKLKALNAGFSSARFSNSYLDYIDKVLEDKSNDKIIVLGITPGVFIDDSFENDGFLSSLEEKRYRTSILPAKIQVQFYWIENSFASFDIDLLWNLKYGNVVNRSINNNYIQIFHDDGWVQSDFVKRQPQKQISYYRRAWNKYSVSEYLVDLLVEKVKYWTSQEIQVIAVNMPTTPEMQEVEAKLSKLNLPILKRRMENAGALWLEFPVAQFTSYDGSHLESESARKLSRMIVDKIRYSE